MSDERDTNSFRVTPSVLGFIIAAVLGAVGGSGGTALLRSPAPAVQAMPGNYVTREEFDRTNLDFKERLLRIEEKLDRLSETQRGRH